MYIDVTACSFFIDLIEVLAFLILAFIAALFILAQSFFLWDNPSPTHQRRLMSMSFKKKYSSSG